MFPSVSARQIVEIMIGCAAASVVTGGYLLVRTRGGRREPTGRPGRDSWRMPPLDVLSAR